MLIENSLTISAARGAVFDAAAHIEQWPKLLPHYRQVTVLRDTPDGRLAFMSARRDGIPVSWTSIQGVHPDAGTITYRHVRGVTRGMVVEWTFQDQSDGVHVRITHEFDPPWPRPAGPWLADKVICHFFVHNIADKTLHHLKRSLESAAPHAIQNSGGQL